MPKLPTNVNLDDLGATAPQPLDDLPFQPLNSCVIDATELTVQGVQAGVQAARHVVQAFQQGFLSELQAIRATGVLNFRSTDWNFANPAEAQLLIDEALTTVLGVQTLPKSAELPEFHDG